MSTEEREYIIAEIPYLFAHLNYTEKFSKLLSDYDFICLKISLYGTNFLIPDYDLMDLHNLDLNHDVKQSLKIIQSAIILAENVLSKDKKQLASQLWGRLSPEQSHIIKKLLYAAKERSTCS